VASYLLMVGLMVVVGSIMKQGKAVVFERDYFLRVFRVWIYSYLPTALWFAMVAGLFMVLPPPRYESVLGFLFSAFFLGISTGLLILKGLLYYLTLRLALDLNPKQIFWSTLVIVPVVIFYARLMYVWHIFNVPFI